MLTRCMSSVASWMRASRRYCTIRLVQSDWLDFDSVRRWPWELTALQLEKTHAKRQNTSKLRKHLHQCGHRTVLCSGQMKANSSSNWHRSSEMHMCPVMSWISTNCFFFFFFSHASPAEVELLQGAWTGHPHGEAAHRRVHGEEAQPQELPFKDPGY